MIRSTIEVLLGSLLSVLTARMEQVALPRLKESPVVGTVMETPWSFKTLTKLPNALES